LNVQRRLRVGCCVGVVTRGYNVDKTGLSCRGISVVSVEIRVVFDAVARTSAEFNENNTS